MDNTPENPLHSMAAHELEMQMRSAHLPGAQLQAPGSLHSPAVPPPLLPPPGLAMLPTTTHSLQPPPGLPPALQSSNWTDDLALDSDTTDLPSLMAVQVTRPDDEQPTDEKNGSPEELVLPKALEDVFAFKDQLADELGRGDGEIPADTHFNEHRDGSKTVKATAGVGVISGEYADADGESDEDDNNFLVPNAPLLSTKANRPDNKNKKKKKRKQLNRQKKAAAAAAAAATASTNAASVASDADGKNSTDDAETDSSTKSDPKTNGDKKASTIVTDADDEVTVEYVPDKITVAELAPMYRQFYRVFELFKLEDRAATAAKEAAQASADEKAAQLKKEAAKQMMMEEDDDDMDDDGKHDDKERLSKRKLKKLTRLSVAELKQLVQRPDVVEMHDVTARDPKLLVQLKAHRNTVQVPRHWCFKRKYLQGKRGIEKPPFDLPAFIKKTGIMEMRASLQEKDEAKTLKAKMRERARPKMGKIDIDYQKLHDAFFKWQTKPRMTIHGDLYYEGKEFETRLKEKKPGDLSEELRTALGMPIGPNCHKIPPPWLIAQQRYGPPPSYPNLKIPGLNAPIPEGTSFGYHAGGWGKPPVDEKGKPLYGDVFGTNNMDPDGVLEEGDIDRNMWGELESESEESSEEEEDEGEDLADVPDESGLVTPAEGLVTPSGLTSGVPPGLETPDTIELRKKKIENEMEDNETPVLYQVLAEKRGDRIGASMMGSTHVYDMSQATGGKPPQSSAAASGATGGRAVEREGMVELALDPSELDMDNDAMAQRYEQQMREQQSHLQKEDLSDMLAEHVARQKSKRKRQQGTETAATKQTKKYKEFKF